MRHPDLGQCDRTVALGQPRAVMAAGAIMDGARGGINIGKDDAERVKNHLAKYYKKMGDTAPWERD